MFLPLELQEAIIDEFSEDRLQLSVNSFVCKNWRLRSYSHAFSTLRLSQSSVYHFAQFLLIQFSSSAIFSQVRHITLGPSKGPYIWDTKQLTDLYEILLKLSSFGKIASLTIQSMTLLDVGGKPLALIQKSFQTTTTLLLTSVQFDNISEFVELVLSFPALQTTTLKDVLCLRTVGSIASTPRLPRGVYNLSWCISEYSILKKMVRWKRLNSMRSPSRDEIASLGTLASINHQDISSFTVALGCSLYDLELASHAQSLRAQDAFQSLNLSKTNSLKHFSAGSSNHVLSLMPWLLQILTQIRTSSSSSLKSLKIVFASSRQFYLDQPFLRSLSGILSRNHFSSLEVIYFVAFNNCVDKDAEVAVKRHIREVFDVWYQLDVLRFIFPMRRQITSYGGLIS